MFDEKKYQEQYRKTHKKEATEYRKKYQKLHKEEIKDHYQKVRKEYYKKRYLKNKIKLLKQHREWYQSHKKESNQYLRNKRKTDFAFKLLCNLRLRVWLAFKGRNKSKHTLELLGCSIDFLKQHLEKQFKQGMSWDNYGFYGWHIDHIKPCASFDLSKPKEQKLCFNYKNLRPLWAKENLSRKRIFQGDKL